MTESVIFEKVENNIFCFEITPSHPEKSLARKYNMCIYFPDGNKVLTRTYLSLEKFFEKNKEKEVDIVFKSSLLFNNESKSEILAFKFNFFTYECDILPSFSYPDYEILHSGTDITQIRVEILELKERYLSRRDYLLMRMKKVYYSYYPYIIGSKDRLHSLYFETSPPTPNDDEFLFQKKLIILEIRCHLMMYRICPENYLHILMKLRDKKCIKYLFKKINGWITRLSSAIEFLNPHSNIINSLRNTIKLLGDSDNEFKGIVLRKLFSLLSIKKGYSIFVLKNIILIHVIRIKNFYLKIKRR